MNLIEKYKGPNSTQRLREIRNEIMIATANEKGCVTHSVTIHFFKDCWIGFHNKSNNGRYVEFTHKVYSKDFGITWNPYHDEFEPSDEYHRAVQYDPSDSSFPTKTW